MSLTHADQPTRTSPVPAATPHDAGTEGVLPAPGSLMLEGLTPVREIGVGKVARVTLVEQTSSGMLAVTKAPAEDDYERAKLLRAEMRVVNQLLRDGCVNVPSIAMEIGHTPPVIMYEYVPHPIEERVAAGLSEQDVRRYFSQLCDVMGALHRMNPTKYHGDLKPSSVRATEDGILKLVDVNGLNTETPIARDSILVSTSMRGSDGVATTLATYKYMAPEQINDGHPADTLVDVYLTAQMLHYLCSGTIPKKGTSPNLEGVYEFLNPVLQRAMGPREGRPASIEELKNEVEIAFENKSGIASHLAVRGTDVDQAAQRSVGGRLRSDAIVTRFPISDGARISLHESGRFASVTDAAGVTILNLAEGGQPVVCNTARRSSAVAAFDATGTSLIVSSGAKVEQLSLDRKGGFWKESAAVLAKETLSRRSNYFEGKVWDRPTAMSPDGTLLVTRNVDTLYFHSLKLGAPSHRVTELGYWSIDRKGPDPVTIFSQSGDLAAIVRPDEFVVVRPRELSASAIFCERYEAQDVAFHAADRLVAVSRREGVGSRVHIYRIETDGKASSVDPFALPTRNAKLTFGSRTDELITGGDDGVLRVVSLAKDSPGKVISTCRMNGPITALGTAARGSLVMAADTREAVVFGV